MTFLAIYVAIGLLVAGVAAMSRLWRPNMPKISSWNWIVVCLLWPVGVILFLWWQWHPPLTEEETRRRANQEALERQRQASSWQRVEAAYDEAFRARAEKQRPEATARQRADQEASSSSWQRVEAAYDEAFRARTEKQRAEQEASRTVRERIPERVRNEVWRRDQGRCARCGSRERLEFDHIVPVSLGGSNTARNLELLCELCNRQKGARI